MPDIHVGVNADVLRRLLTYATTHSHSQSWLPALHAIAIRLGVRLYG
jgi:hypothetical protein